MAYKDVELGDELPEAHPDVSLERVREFVKSSGMDFPRFTNHEQARKEGLPGAVVPGIMSQGILAVMIHGWAPGCTIKKLDTLFRSPILVGSSPVCTGAVTNTDDASHTVEIDLTITTDTGQTAVIGSALVELAPD